MTRASILSIFLLLLSAAAGAQGTSDRSMTDRLPIYIGPVAGINGAVSMIDYKVSDQQRSLSAGSLFAVAGDFALNENVSVLARLGYYTLSFSDENNAVNIPTPGGLDYVLNFPNPIKLKTEGTFTYISLATMIRIGYFAVGFQFSLPHRTTITNSITNWPMPYTQNGYTLKSDISPTESERNFMVEATIGGDFPVWSSSSGILRLGLFASYPLSQMATTTGKNLPRMDNNLRLPSVMLQIAYLLPV